MAGPIILLGYGEETLSAIRTAVEIAANGAAIGVIGVIDVFGELRGRIVPETWKVLELDDQGTTPDCVALLARSYDLVAILGLIPSHTSSKILNALAVTQVRVFATTVFGIEVAGFPFDFPATCRFLPTDGFPAEGKKEAEEVHRAEMTAKMDQIDAYTLAVEILEHYHLRRPNAEVPLRDYNLRRLSLMARELGVSDLADCFGITPPGDAPTLNPGRLGQVRHPGILETMPSAFSRLSEPMSGYLEYSPVAGEREIHEQYREPIREMTASLRRQWAAFYRDLLVLGWPSLATASTTWTRLKELGLGEHEDEYDWF